MNVINERFLSTLQIKAFFTHVNYQNGYCITSNVTGIEFFVRVFVLQLYVTELTYLHFLTGCPILYILGII